MCLLLVTFAFSLTPLFAQVEECDQLNKALIEQGNPYWHFHEDRNDVGIFYDFEWKDEEIKIKRDDNYPIVRFSLFDKKNILPGTVIKTFNGIDLSKINDLEMLQTFNCGIGMAVIVDEKNISKADKVLKKNKQPYKIIFSFFPIRVQSKLLLLNF